MTIVILGQPLVVRVVYCTTEFDTMKTSSIPSLALLAVSTVFLMSNSNGVAHQQNKDRTGAPGSDNTCEQCHAGGSFAPQVNAFLVAEGDVALAGEYIPGATHSLMVEVSGSGSPAGFGVHGTVVFADGTNAGSFADQDANDCIWLDEVDGRHIFEQNDLCSSGMFEIEWTAPPAGSGTVELYVAAIAANGNGVSSGDSFAGGQFSFAELVSGMEDVEPTMAMEATSPAEGQLQVVMAQPMKATVLTLDGRVLYDGELEMGRHMLNLGHRGLVVVHGLTASGSATTHKVWLR